MKNILAYKKSLLVGFAVCAATASLVAGGCDSTIEDVSSGRKSSNVATTENDGVLTASLTFPNTVDQTMVYSDESGVTFPPGALTLPTKIAMSNAKDMASQIVGEVGGGALLVQGGPPLFVGVESGDTPVLQDPMTLNLPLPITSGNLSLAGGKLVFIYVVNTSSGWKSGVKLLTVDNLIGTFVNLKVVGLGYFQIVYVTDLTVEKEVSSAVRPAIKKASEASNDPTDHPFGCYKALDKVCVRYGANNPGAAADKIKYCKNTGQALKECPTTGFVASCYYASSDQKYYFYTGHANSGAGDCTDGSYSTTYSAATP